MADTEKQMYASLEATESNITAVNSPSVDSPDAGTTDGGAYSEPAADGPPADTQPSAPGDGGDGGYEQKNEEAIELQAMATSGTTNQDTTTSVLKSMEQKYYLFESEGKILSLRLTAISDAPQDISPSDRVSLVGGPVDKKRTMTVEQIKKAEKQEEIFSLVPDSTNAWLYIQDDDVDEDEDSGAAKNCGKCSDDAANKFIAIFVILLQIAAYIVMTVFLRNKYLDEIESREKTCYGANCQDNQRVCMDFGTGGLTSVLLVGFLWADVINTVSIARKNCQWFMASMAITAELVTAIVCGFLVGLYSESDFDAIGGAVGILFVHDLDEKVFASMQVFRGTPCATFKKVLAISFWIIISVTMALVLACRYEEGALIGSCKEGEFQCGNGDCIWSGFVCNGVLDCSDGSDEDNNEWVGGKQQCNYALNNYCPEDETFQCIEDGSCIDISKRCNGILDCPGGSDEGREQNCAEVIRQIKCSETNFQILDKYPDVNDSYHKVWNGTFKCNNGQCIDARYACDGTAGDCVDGSDEYPDFNKRLEWPFLKDCPYAALVECGSEESLCKVDGKCIGKSALCDGNYDCSDGADEKGCDYDCTSNVISFRSYQCGGKIAKINESHIIPFSTNPNFTISQAVGWDRKSSITYTPYFEGETGKCIPIQWRCDGTVDCDDGDDELACYLFTCASDQYQCPGSGSCIAKSWLCDGVQDCPGGQDEQQAVCLQNGVSISSNECIQQGYAYQCEGYSGFCLYQYEMCDNYQSCPNGDDEIQENCDAAANAASSSSSSQNPSGSGTELTCGETLIGTASNNQPTFLTFTLPSSYSKVSMSTCTGDNEGEAYLYMYDSSGSSYLYANPDYSCVGCSYSAQLLLGDTDGGDSYTSYGITANVEYTVEVYPYFSGQFAIVVECSNSQLNGGGVCSGSSSSGGGSSGGGSSGGGGSSSGLECGSTTTGNLEYGGTVLLEFTPTNDVTLSGCNSDFDTVFTVYKSTDFTTQIAYNDDSSSCSSNSYASIVSVTYDSGYSGSYYLQIQGYGGTSYGSYSVQYTCGSSGGGGGSSGTTTTGSGGMGGSPTNNGGSGSTPYPSPYPTWGGGGGTPYPSPYPTWS